LIHPVATGTDPLILQGIDQHNFSSSSFKDNDYLKGSLLRDFQTAWHMGQPFFGSKHGIIFLDLSDRLGARYHNVAAIPVPASVNHQG
jgi:hypothetical protein